MLSYKSSFLFQNIQLRSTAFCSVQTGVQSHDVVVVFGRVAIDKQHVPAYISGNDFMHHHFQSVSAHLGIPKAGKGNRLSFLSCCRILVHISACLQNASDLNQPCSLLI